ncbi:hypothetical protein AAFF_G00090000 [Aldrovandia affinis]|uniref:ZP domain-containing protein n=1 Tax=Aldrovandia affinis TaxID=143900 RepID=A0AAD7RW63_9TELE|nr:hypothetical protein AAFF_G00090000 [Aldrovandia affinis]
MCALMCSSMWGWAAVVALGLGLLSPACEATSLGAIVTVEPLVKEEENKVMAHTSVITPEPCPSLLEEVCEGAKCSIHVTSSLLHGRYPTPGWCLRQWQSVVPSEFTSRPRLGSTTDMVLRSWANLSVRADNQKVNQPPHVALFPPLRVSINCFRRFYLSVRDMDGDRVQCRYGNPKLGECQSCSRLAFLQLDEVRCVLEYDGHGKTGQYTVELMVEDFNGDSEALSSTPLQLSLTVEGESTHCEAVPEFTGQTPAGGTTFTIMPYEEVHITAEAHSSSETVSEIAVVGPPGLSVSTLKGGEREGSLASINIAWFRNPNELPHLLSVCFTANTKSSQSEIGCVWIQQKPVDPLPPGTVLECGDKEMNFILPITSLHDLPLTDLHLNDASCPISHNTTHVMALISLTGCGTKIVHSGSELVYTNTLQSARSPSPISRLPMLLLHLACSFPSILAKAHPYNIVAPNEEQIFGDPQFWIEIYRIGEGPFGRLTKQRKDRRVARSAVQRASRQEVLDLHIFSNSSLDRAELIVGSCMKSNTSDFQVTQPLLEGGCVSGNKSLEVLTQTPLVKIYQLELTSMDMQGNTVYIECQVHLCITINSSQKCADLCGDDGTNLMVESILTHIHTIRSSPITLFNGPPPPTTSAPSALSRAPEDDNIMAMGLALGLIHTFLQFLFHQWA